MSNISKKIKWISTGGWRGHAQFENAVAGANDTGMWDGSPCPSTLRKAEIAMATSALRKAGIRYRTGWCRTSNVFSNSMQVIVAPEDRARAIEILLPLHDQTDLLWVEKK